MSVVVTGAAGFIGGHLVRALVARGHSVVGVDRRPGMPDCATATVVTDLAEPSPVVDDLLAGADAVFHLAARAGVRDGADSDAVRWRDNVDAARRVVDAVPLEVPLVVTSSSSVYGGADGSASSESDRLRPRGAYARSKVELERVCARRVSRGGVVAVARPFTVAGEDQRPDMAVARWLAAAHAGEPLPVLGGPGRTRDVTDVRDVVEGLIRLAERGVRSTVNLGTGCATSLADLAAAVLAAVGRAFEPAADLVVLPDTGDEPAHTLADTRRCAALLGFVPRGDVRALVARQAAATQPLPLDAR